tara:strand:+ start:2603 stop:3865 length:1263 start_codon:yes stop_codon:yes gene_type:complete
MKLFQYFILIGLIVVAVGSLSFLIAGQVTSLRNVELPMEQNLREVEVSVWEAIHAANAFSETGDVQYEELYARQVNDVNEFFPKYKELVEEHSATEDINDKEQAAIKDFEKLWEEAQEAGGHLIVDTKEKKEQKLLFFEKVDDADDIIDSEIQTLPLSLEQEQPLREVEVSVWEAIHAVNEYLTLSGTEKGTTLFGEETFKDIYVRQKADVNKFWPQFKVVAPPAAAGAIARFDALWAEAVAAGDKVIEIEEHNDEEFDELFEKIDLADEIIDHQMQDLIQQRIALEDAAAGRTKIIAALVTLLALLATLGLGYFISRRITVPLEELTKSVDEVSKGNLTTKVQTKKSIREINMLAEALDRVMTTMKRAIKRAKPSTKVDVKEGTEQVQEADKNLDSMQKQFEQFQQWQKGMKNTKGKEK